MHFLTAREAWTPSDIQLAQKKSLAALPGGDQLRLERQRPSLLRRLRKRFVKPTPLL